MAHEAAWEEKVRTGGTIKFVCRKCGRHASGPEKKYDKGEWFPPENH